VPHNTTTANISAAVAATAVVNASHHTPSINHSAAIKNSASLNNVLELDSSVQTAWLNLIQKLDEKNIALSSVNTKKHRIQTQNLGITYTPDFKSIRLNPKETDKHQFKILVLPGPTNEKATLVVYHVKQSLQTSNQKIAAAFLKYLELK